MTIENQTCEKCGKDLGIHMVSTPKAHDVHINCSECGSNEFFGKKIPCTTLEITMLTSKWLTNHFTDEECEKLWMIAGGWKGNAEDKKQFMDALLIITKAPSIVTYERFKELKTLVQKFLK